MSRTTRSLLSLCLLGACTGWTRAALTQEGSKQLCLDAYESAQMLTREGDLLKARKRLEYCASSACPQLMHGDCQRWLLQVEASIPTVVFVIETPSGSIAGPANVRIDEGEPVPVDGRAMSVNPGKHQVAFWAEGLQSATREFVFTEGEKLRRELVVLEPPKTAIRAGKARRPKTPAGEAPGGGVAFTVPMLLTSSVAVIGGAGFAYFGLTARAEDRALDDCSPYCTRSKVDNVKRSYLLANVSLGVGLAGLLGTVVLVLLQEPDTKASSLSVGPLTAARGLSLTGRF